MKICSYCSVCFLPKKNKKDQMFCSRSCSAKFRYTHLKVKPKVKNGKEKKCLICDKTLYIRPSEINKKYCSRRCSGLGSMNGKKRSNKIQILCPNCKKSFSTSPSTLKLNKTEIKFCSVSCKSIAMKEQKLSYGFKRKLIPLESNPRKRIQIDKIRYYEYRLIMEKQLGRKLLKKEHVHHINENPKDNRLENLQVLSAEEHGRIHALAKATSFPS